MDNKRLSEVRQRAQGDAKFMEELRADPEGVLRRETGATRAELERQVTELSDSELRIVSGGSGKEFVCRHCRQIHTFADLYFLHMLFEHGELP